MICTKCGAEMDQTDKDTSSGRVIREYVCRNCGHDDWEDEGVALWQALHDAREQDEAEAAERAAENSASGLSNTSAPPQNQRASLRRRIKGLFRRKKQDAEDIELTR